MHKLRTCVQAKLPISSNRLQKTPPSAGLKDVAGAPPALISQPSTRHRQADICTSGQSAAGHAQADQPCSIIAASGHVNKPEKASACKHEAPLAVTDQQQPVANLCTAPCGSNRCASETAGSKEQPSQDENAAHDADVSSALELPAKPESCTQPAVPLKEDHKTASCSPAAVESTAVKAAKDMAAQPDSISMPSIAAATRLRIASVHVESEADSMQPADSVSAPQLEPQDSNVQPKVDSRSPVHKRSLSGQSSSSAQVAHQRQLSGESSKGSALSGNPYAGSCGGSRAGSMGGSPGGSLEPLEPIQTHLQHELSGIALPCLMS